MPVAQAPRAREINEVADPGFLRALVPRIGELHLQAFAAGLAYGAVFALVPVLALLVMLLGVFNAVGIVERAIDQADGVLPAEMVALLEEQLRSLATTQDQAGLGIGLVVSAGIALWGASGAMRRVMEALNVVNGAEETRGFVTKLVVSSLLALGAILTIAVTCSVMVLGGEFADRAFGVLGIAGAGPAWAWLRWPLLVVVVWVAIAAAYRFAPATHRRGGIATPGTLLATLGWVGFSALFSWHVGRVGDMSATWGAVAGLVVFLLYLQYTGLIVLLGALVDAQLVETRSTANRANRLLRRAKRR